MQSLRLFLSDTAQHLVFFAFMRYGCGQIFERREYFFDDNGDGGKRHRTLFLNATVEHRNQLVVELIEL